MNPLHPENSAAPLGPYSPAMDCGDIIFFSGQIAVDNNGDFKNQSLETELEQVFSNIDALLVAGKLTKKNIPKVTVFLSDLEDFSAMNARYAQYFEDHKPARSTFQVAKLPLNARVEIEIIAKR